MEAKHTHWKTLVNPDYIGAYCTPEDKIVKILSVGRQVVKGEGGKTEECTVAQLENSKPFILNRTNCKTISKIYGTPFIEDWAGKLITIFPTTTKVAGETVECLRVRPTAPVIAKADYSLQVRMLQECKTIEELQTIYLGLTKDQQAGTTSTKDEMKAKLSAV